MVEYDFKDIIIDPSDERLEIGAEYYAGDDIRTVLTTANAGKFQTKKLIRIEDTVAGNFTLKDNNEKEYVYWLLIRKKEEDNPSFKIGDFIELDGRLFLILDVKEKIIIYARDYKEFGRNVEYFKDVKKVKAHVEPYDLSDPKTRNMLRGVWVKRKHGDGEFAITNFSLALKEWWALGETTKGLLEGYTFLDGAPVGKYVLDEEEEE